MVKQRGPNSFINIIILLQIKIIKYFDLKNTIYLINQKNFDLVKKK